MEQHYAQTEYVSDLEALIFQHKHLSVGCEAERNVLENLITETKSKCDTVVEDLKKFDEASNSDEKKNLTKKLFCEMSKLKYYREKLEDCKQRATAVNSQLHDLMMQRLHMDVVHGI